MLDSSPGNLPLRDAQTQPAFLSCPHSMLDSGPEILPLPALHLFWPCNEFKAVSMCLIPAWLILEIPKVSKSARL